MKKNMVLILLVALLAMGCSEKKDAPEITSGEEDTVTQEQVTGENSTEEPPEEKKESRQQGLPNSEVYSAPVPQTFTPTQEEFSQLVVPASKKVTGLLSQNENMGVTVEEYLTAYNAHLLEDGLPEAKILSFSDGIIDLQFQGVTGVRLLIGNEELVESIQVFSTSDIPDDAFIFAILTGIELGEGITSDNLAVEELFQSITLTDSDTEAEEKDVDAQSSYVYLGSDYENAEDPIRISFGVSAK